MSVIHEDDIRFRAARKLSGTDENDAKERGHHAQEDGFNHFFDGEQQFFAGFGCPQPCNLARLKFPKGEVARFAGRNDTVWHDDVYLECPILICRNRNVFAGLPLAEFVAHIVLPVDLSLCIRSKIAA